MDKKHLLDLLIDSPEEARELGQWLLNRMETDTPPPDEAPSPSGPGPVGDSFEAPPTDAEEKPPDAPDDSTVQEQLEFLQKQLELLASSLQRLYDTVEKPPDSRPRRLKRQYLSLLCQGVAAIWLLAAAAALIYLPLTWLAGALTVSVSSILAVMLALAVVLVYKGEELAAWLWPTLGIWDDQDDEED